MSRVLNKIATNFLKTLKPPKSLSLSDWADNYRYLSPEASAEAGRWRTSRVEVAREIMNAVTDINTQSVTVVACTQLLKTELLNNVAGYYIHQDPAPILLIQPTDKMAESWSKDRFSPMLRDSPTLRKVVGWSKAKKTNNTILHKSFAGGHISITGANSPANLASRPIRVVLCDEVDKYPQSAGVEGDVVSLAQARAATFWNRKFISVCSPTLSEGSKIWDLYEQSDMREYHVPCPFCKEKQKLIWKNVVFERDEKDNLIDGSVYYKCEHCNQKWNDVMRMKAVQKGVWIAQKEFKGHAGFHVNKIASPWEPLQSMVEAFLKANKKAKRGDIQDLKTFINTQLAECFDEDKSEKTDEISLMSRAEPYTKVPSKVKILTCGCDVQRDRIEGEVVGWGVGQERWGIEYFTIYGNTSEEYVWEELNQKLKSRYECEDGNTLAISTSCIDTGGGGGQTDMAYRFCKSNQKWRIYAVKGANVDGKPIASKPSKNNALKVKLFQIGTDAAKGIIYSRLKIIEEGEGFWNFPIGNGYDAEYYLQLTSEVLKTKFDRGRKTVKWTKIRARNEALDCAVYALAALHIYNPSLSILNSGIISNSGVENNIQPEVKLKNTPVLRTGLKIRGSL